MEKIYILWGTLKIGVKWHGHIIWHFLWLFHSLSTFPHSTAVTPTTSVSQYLGQEKQKESSMWNPKLIIWKPSMFFLFQTITDAGRWSVRERQHQNNWVCVCVCAHVHLVLLSLDWLWKSMDFRSYSVTECSTTSTLQFVWQDVLFLVLSQALNIHCNNVCFYFVQIINTIYQKNA